MGLIEMAAQEGQSADDYKKYADKARERKIGFLGFAAAFAILSTVAGFKHDFWELIAEPNGINEISLDGWATVTGTALLTVVTLAAAARYQYFESAIRKNEKKARAGQKAFGGTAEVLSHPR